MWKNFLVLHRKCYLRYVPLIFIFFSYTSLAQTTVTGKVTTGDAPLIGVSVLVKGSKAGTVTNESGSFSLNAPSNSTLVFSYTGYIPKEVAVNGQSSIDIQLAPDVASLGEVVVVAYGNTTRRSTTGAIQTVGAKELQDLPVAQFTQKLQGKLAGVQINQTTGKPGQGMLVRIRGSASISAGGSPLYVVDGFPVVGDISNINPDEIENITVLKDAASTSLYGSRAAFGVVVVTTKQARAGQTNIGFSAYTGVQRVPKKGRPAMMNATEFAQFKKESYEDLGRAVPAQFQNPSQYGEGYDWYDAMLRSATISDYSLSFRSNTEKFTTSIVAGYFQQEGVLLNSDYKRFSLRANSLIKVTNNFRVGFNVAPTYSITNAPATDGLFFGSGGLINNALLTWPMIPIKNPDGSLPLTAYIPGVSAFPAPNWVRSIQEITNKNKTNRLLSNAYVEYEPINHLVLKTSINIDMGQSLFNAFNPSTASTAFASLPPVTASLFQSNYQYYSWLSENTATYGRQIKDHNIDVLGGYTVQRFRGDYSQIRGTNFPDDRIRTIQSAANIDKPATYSDIQEWSLLSFIGRLNYNYKNRYLLGASLRRDGSSRFGADNKYGNFGSVSAGWVVSEEEFVKRISWLPFLKLRASYGTVGNNNIGNYDQYATVNNTTNTVFGSNVATGASVTSLSNSRLGWETTKEFDFGIDMGLFNNRVTFSYDYYIKRTTNFLFRLPVPRESGFSSFLGNVGEIKFWGHEFAITSTNMKGKLNWITHFNIAFSDNKVLALSNLSDTLYGDHSITVKGGRIGQFYGLIQDGVYRDQADFDRSPKNINSQVGTIKFRDLNGDGVIKYGNSEGDKTIIGNPYPDFVFGITNSFNYKNIDLTIVAAGTYGNKIARLMDEGTTNLDGVFNVLKEVKDRWRSPQNLGSGRYGKTTGSTADDRAQFHTRFVQDGSYLTIKNITVGYNLPVQRIKMFSNVRVFASIQQAFVFTGYGGANPEISTDFNGNGAGALGQGLDYSAYPVPRTFTVGLNVNLK